jgi:hypothetical protein
MERQLVEQAKPSEVSSKEAAAAAPQVESREKQRPRQAKKTKKPAKKVH